MKWLAVLFMCAILSLSLTACDNGETVLEDTDPSQDVFKITMLYDDNASYPMKDDWLVLTEIEKRLNIDLELQVIEESDFRERKKIIINSGDMPDIIAKTFEEDIRKYISSGIFLPISDYVDQMPNYQSFIEKYSYQEELESIKEKDGKYYVLPVNCNPERVTNHGWMIRMDLIEAYDLELPETMDEVYELCKVFKEKNPDIYPMTNRFGTANIVSKVAEAFDTIGGWNLGDMFQYIEADDHFIFAPTSDHYKEMLMWFNKMYSEGLLDVEFSTLESTAYEEKAITGKQFIMVDWIGNEVRYNLAGPQQSGEINFDIQPFMPPKGPRGSYSGARIPMYEQGWAINAKVAERDDFPRFLECIDWLYSDEAAELLSFGIEGETFEVLENGRKEFIDLTVDYSKKYGINNNCLTVRRDDDLFASNKSQYELELFDQMIEAGVFTKIKPRVTLDEAEKEILSQYNTILNTYITEMTDQFIAGKVSFDQWDEFVTECEKKGSLELYELYNNAWENKTNDR